MFHLFQALRAGGLRRQGVDNGRADFLFRHSHGFHEITDEVLGAFVVRLPCFDGEFLSAQDDTMDKAQDLLAVAFERDAGKDMVISLAGV